MPNGPEMATAFLGTTGAEAATHNVVAVSATPSNLTVGQQSVLTASITPAQNLLEPGIPVSFTIVSGPNKLRSSFATGAT